MHSAGIRKFTLNLIKFTWNEIICEELFCPMLGFSEFEASQNPSKMLQRQHKALQYVAINHLFVSTLQWNALHIQQSSFIHHIINLHPPNIQNVIDIPSEYSALAPPKCRSTETTATTDGSGITSTTSGAAISWCLSYQMTPKFFSLIICPL